MFVKLFSICFLLTGMFFIAGSLGAYDLNALTVDGSAPMPVLLFAGCTLLCSGLLFMLTPQRQRYPGLYAFAGASLASALSATIALDIALQSHWSLSAWLISIPFMISALCCLFWSGLMWRRWGRITRASRRLRGEHNRTRG